MAATTVTPMTWASAVAAARRGTRAMLRAASRQPLPGRPWSASRAAAWPGSPARRGRRTRERGQRGRTTRSPTTAHRTSPRARCRARPSRWCGGGCSLVGRRLRDAQRLDGATRVAAQAGAAAAPRDPDTTSSAAATSALDRGPVVGTSIPMSLTSSRSPGRQTRAGRAARGRGDQADDRDSARMPVPPGAVFAPTARISPTSRRRCANQDVEGVPA